METGMCHNRASTLERRVALQQEMIDRLNARLNFLEFGIEGTGSAEDPCRFDEDLPDVDPLWKGKARAVGPTRRGQRASRGRRGTPYPRGHRVPLGDHYLSETEGSGESGARS